MMTKPIHEGCTVIRYGSKRYLLNAAEMTNFLQVCDAMGLPDPKAISQQFDLIIDQVLAAPADLPGNQLLSVKLLRETSLAMQGFIFKDSEAG